MTGICMLTSQMSVQLQKEVKSNPKQPSYKKLVEGCWEKHVKLKVVAKYSCDDTSVAKSLIMTKFVCPPNFTKISINCC